MLVKELYYSLKKDLNNDEELAALKEIFSFFLKKNLNFAYEESLTKELQENIERSFQEYKKGNPIAYILKEKYFLDNKFYVDEKVLIPRFETEELVLKAFEEINDNIKTIVDIGTGSGVIAIMLKKTFSSKKVIATDIDSQALEVFKINRERHNTEIDYYLGDALDPLIKRNIKVDMIISNPPYISFNYTLDKWVNKEPKIALYAENDGLAVYEKILKEAPNVLNKKGIIILEIGFDQKEKINNLINKLYSDKVETYFYKDIENNDRIVVIKFK